MSRIPTSVRLPPFVPFGGISHQPDNRRFANQLENASNALLSLLDGASKRPGTWFVRDLTSDLSGSSYRMFPVRIDSDSYLAVYGSAGGTMSVKLYEMAGLNLKATVTTSANAQTYLDTGTPTSDDIVMRSVGDDVLIINRKATPALTTSDDYSVSRVRRDYEALVSLTVTQNYYLRTEDDSTRADAGHYKYNYGTYSYAHINFQTLETPWTIHYGYWDDATYYPCGFRIAFRRVNLAGFTNATWDNTAKTLTKANAFTGYTWRAGDMIYITGGTGFSANTWYKITGKNSDSVITLYADVAGTADVAADVTDATYSETNRCRIGLEVEAVTDLTDPAVESMDEIAYRLQKAMRDAGAYNACCAWVPQGKGGNFQITAPFRGDNAMIYYPTPPTASFVGTAGDLTAVNLPFDSASGQLYGGSGGTAPDAQDTATPESRWTRVAPPAQSGAKFSPTTMPVRLSRTYDSSSGTITGNTVANPTVITSASHGLVSGQSVIIEGSNSVPPITDGTYVVTVIDANTFSVPFNVTTTPGTAGTWKRAAIFAIDTTPWAQRDSGDTTTNPAPNLVTNGRKISDAAVYFNRLCLFGGPYIMASQTGKLYTFFKADSGQTVESDPLDLTVSDEQNVSIRHAAQFEDGLILFSVSGKQFDFTGDGGLTPTTARIKTATNYQTRDVTPRVAGNELYYVGLEGHRSMLYEYRTYEETLVSAATDVSTQIPTLIGNSVRSMAVSGNNRFVILCPSSSSKLYVYRAHWDGIQKKQSAWSVYEFDPSYSINDVVTIGDRVYMLTKTANIWFIERLPILEFPDSTHYDDVVGVSSFAPSPPYYVHLDRKFYRTSGTYFAGKTTWDLGVQTPGSTVNRAVDCNDGAEYTLDYWSGTTVGITGVDLSAKSVVLGCAYTFRITLSSPFMPREDSENDLAIEAMPTKLTVQLTETGDATVRVQSVVPNAVDYTKTHTATTGELEDKIIDADVGGRARDLTVSIENATARACTVSAIQWTINPQQGVR